MKESIAAYFSHVQTVRLPLFSFLALSVIISGRTTHTFPPKTYYISFQIMYGHEFGWATTEWGMELLNSVIEEAARSQFYFASLLSDAMRYNAPTYRTFMVKI